MLDSNTETPEIRAGDHDYIDMWVVAVGQRLFPLEAGTDACGRASVVSVLGPDGGLNECPENEGQECQETKQGVRW